MHKRHIKYYMSSIFRVFLTKLNRTLNSLTFWTMLFFNQILIYWQKVHYAITYVYFCKITCFDYISFDWNPVYDNYQNHLGFLYKMYIFTKFQTFWKILEFFYVVCTCYFILNHSTYGHNMWEFLVNLYSILVFILTI